MTEEEVPGRKKSWDELSKNAKWTTDLDQAARLNFFVGNGAIYLSESWSEPTKLMTAFYAVEQAYHDLKPLLAKEEFLDDAFTKLETELLLPNGLGFAMQDHQRGFHTAFLEFRNKIQVLFDSVRKLMQDHHLAFGTGGNEEAIGTSLRAAIRRPGMTGGGG